MSSNVRAQVTADSSNFQKAMRAAVLSMKELSSEYSLASTQAKLFGSAQDALKAKVEELKAKISAQTDIVKLNETQQKKLEDTLKEQKEKQASLASQIEKTKQAIAESAEATGENSAETQALKEELAKLEEKEKTAAQVVAKTEEQLTKQETATNKSKEALVKLEAELKNTNKELKEAKWKEFAKNATAAADVLDDVGTKLTKVSAVIAGLGTAAVKVTADFDSQMSTVRAISGATGDEFDALRGKAIEMGSSTAFSASEAGEAMEYMAMAGWTTEDMLAGISGVMAAAAASGEDLSTTSDILTDSLTAFGKSAQDSAHFADVLVAAGNNANTSVSMMGETFKYAGAVCGTLGISVEDAAIATGLMGNAGIKASQAGTALRAGLTNLVKPSKQAAEAMEAYGVSIATTDDGSVDFMATMKGLRQTLGGLESTEQAAAIAAIFGKEAMAGWSAIVNASEGDFTDLTNAIYNCEGAAQEAADIKLDNLSGQITILKSTLEGIAIQIGDILMPTVRNIVGTIQEWATKFSEADDSTKRMIVTIGAVVAAIGPAMLVASKILKTIISVHDTFVKLTPVVKAVMGALGGLVSPVGVVVMAITALVAAIIYLWNTNEEFRTAITNIWTSITTWLSDTLNTIKTTFTNIWTSVKDTVSSVFTTIKNVIQVGIMFIVELVKLAFNLITLPWQFIWQNCGEYIKAAWEEIKTTVGTAIDAVKTTIATVWNSVSSVTTSVWNTIVSGLTTVWNAIKTAISTAINEVNSAVTSVWNAVSGATTTAWNEIKNAVSTPINAAKEAVSTAINAVKSAVTSAWNAIKSATTSTWNAIKSAISTPINAALSTVKSVIDKIKSAFNFSWSLPHLKLPHLSITGSFSIKPPSVPHFSISWYKNGGIMTDPTLFGMAGTTALAGGEAGPEAILPLRPFYDYLNAVLDEKLNRFLEAAESVIYVYCYIDGDQVAAKTVKRVSKAMAGEALRAR